MCAECIYCIVINFFASKFLSHQCNSDLRCCVSSQSGGGSRGGIHTYQANAGRGAEESPRRRDGPTRSCPGHLPFHGSGPAEVPEDHKAAALPQHGEHPATPGLLYHTQHDTQGQSENTSVSCCSNVSVFQLPFFKFYVVTVINAQTSFEVEKVMVKFFFLDLTLLR